jgi:hypothetical protein
MGRRLEQTQEEARDPDELLRLRNLIGPAPPNCAWFLQRQDFKTEGERIMLADQIGEGLGKRTERRVLCTEPSYKVEVSSRTPRRCSSSTG